MVDDGEESHLPVEDYGDDVGDGVHGAAVDEHVVGPGLVELPEVGVHNQPQLGPQGSVGPEPRQRSP